MNKESLICINSLKEVPSFIKGMDGIIFDLDDTLYDEKDYIYSGFKSIAASFPQINNMERKLLKAYQEGLSPIDTVLKNEGFLTQENKSYCLNTYRTHIPDLKLSLENKNLLENLKGQKKLGLITDGRPEGQRAKIQALNLEKYFDSIIITDELGSPEYRKPNPLAFQLMKKNLDCVFHKMCYIGDNIKKDFQAPLKLGMKCIWFKNKNGLYLKA